MKEDSIFLTVKDHSVSGEIFDLHTNKTYGFLETYPQPKGDDLASYYKTEDYISHTDAKRNLFEKAYHLVRYIALKRKLNLINKFGFEAKDLLDIGCGTGDFLKVAVEGKWNITGVEPAKEARAIANKKTNNKVFKTEILEQLEPGSFDVITLWHVLEHLPNLEEQIVLFKKLLKPNGALVIAVPNYKSFDAKYFKSFWAAYDVPRHLWHFDKKAISNLFNSVDMRLSNILPLKFDAYYVSLLSEKYKSGRMNPIKSFWIGWRSNWKARRSKNYSSLVYILQNK